MTGNVYEMSENVGSYRGEQLGLCTIHQLIAALCEFYNINDWHTTINCDNKGVINMSKRNLGRIHPGCSCTDILRNLRNTRNKMSTSIKCHHADDHVDTCLLWHQLALKQKMNTRCDKLAKRAVHQTIVTGMWREGKQLLPSEDVAEEIYQRR